jgi:WD40 repeat protein
VLQHPVGVRAVACTGPGAASNICLTGAADGKGRLWDLNSAGDQPLRELQEAHRGAVTCVAFSPDGAFCATGGDDRDIILWDTASGALRYRLPAEQNHGGIITSLQFTPQSELISAGRDFTLRIWQLGEKGAKLHAVRDGRSGEVGTLGVSADGAQVLFDGGKVLRLLALPDGSSEGLLQAPTGATNFSRIAQFSSDGRLVLTAGPAKENLQLWRAPTATTRGYELRQLVTPEGDTVTCATFGMRTRPDGSEEAFVTAGTRDRQVLVWSAPDRADSEQQLLARITLIDRAIETTQRKVRIAAELRNPNGRLMHGDTATMAIYPAQ